MKSITRFVPLLVVFSLLTSLFLVTPVSAAVAGTVKLDKTYVTSPGGTLKVTLEDKDLDVGVKQTAVGVDFDNVALVTPALTASATFFKRVAKFPILDDDGNGIVNFQDVTVGGAAATGISVLNIDTQGGLVTFVASTTVIIGTAFDLTYTSADTQTTTVKVVSTQDGTGFTLVLKETGATTGKFEASFNTGTSTETTLRNPLTLYDIAGSDPRVDGLVQTLTSTRTVLTGLILESDIGVDLNADGIVNATNTEALLIYVSATSTANETTARRDPDGDGVTTAADAGVDLNNDGDANDAAATGIDVAGLPDATARPVLNAATGGIITASYADGDPSGTRTGTVTVETTKPAVTVKEPGNKSATRVSAARLIVETTDADSLVDKGTIAFYIDSPGTVGVSTILTGEITGGFRAEATLTGVVAGETDIVWHAVATDKAGNVGQSDSDLKTAAFENHLLRVDTVAPLFADPVTAETGHYWDTTDKKIVVDEKKAKRTSVRVIFSEELDGSSVQATDFTVAGVAPQAAEWFDHDNDLVRASVFLTVPEMAANDKPKVALVGDISDRAGNSVSSLDAKTSVDGIAPKIIVDPSPRLDKTSVAIDVTADEPLLTAPNITVNGLTVGVGVVSVIGTNVFRAEFEPADAPNVYNVEVSVTDTVGNVQTAGKTTIDAADAILFEIDSAIPDPATVPANGDKVSNRSPFIEINWDTEGNEYGLPVAGTSTTVKTGIVVDMDSHGVVTLTKLELDGASVLGQENKEGDATWVVPTKDLSLAEHTLVFSGKDEAGNEKSDVTVKFTVIERKAFEVKLTTGWNLVSLPGDPVEPAINDVITLTHPIDTVLTFDPKSAAGWMIARRGDDGKFIGIDTLRKELAYWVRTTRFESLKVEIAPIGGGGAELLPTIGLAQGWNLLPVLDVTDAGAGAETTTVQVGAYFKNVSVTRLYEYNTRKDRFDQVNTTNGTLIFGRGYYVYVKDAAILVP